MKKLYFYLLIFLTISFGNNVLANTPYVYMDMNYILNNSKVGQDILEQLKNVNTLNKKKNIKSEKKLKEEENELLSKKNILNKDEFEKLIITFTKKVNLHNENKKKKLFLN